MGFFDALFGSDGANGGGGESTISDGEWASIQHRARSANKERDRLDSPKGIAARKAAAEQHGKRWWS